VLLAVLLVLLTILVVDYWPTPKAEPAVDPAILTVEQLNERLTVDDTLDCRGELEKRGWRDGPIAVPAAMARIAVALRDESLLQEVLPPLLEGIRAFEEETDYAVHIQSPESNQLMCEALIDVCLWHKNPALTKTVATALRNFEAHKEGWLRKWSRPQLARLQG
jgi:hypothetical protein